MERGYDTGICWLSGPEEASSHSWKIKIVALLARQESRTPSACDPRRCVFGR
jgi:hypothetical protein